jgi:hypothetical protein
MGLLPGSKEQGKNHQTGLRDLRQVNQSEGSQEQWNGSHALASPGVQGVILVEEDYDLRAVQKEIIQDGWC